MSRTAFDPNGFNSPMWAKIRKVTLTSNWQETSTNQYSDGTVTSVVTGIFSGESTNRSDSAPTFQTGVGNFGSAETKSLAGPLMGMVSGFLGSCEGSGTQSGTTTYPDDSTTPIPPQEFTSMAFDFSRESLANTSDLGTAVTWTITGGVGITPYDSANALVIPWGDFDQGGTWTHSWTSTQSFESGSIVTTGTWTITLSL